jgi:hypothetical protein
MSEGKIKSPAGRPVPPEKLLQLYLLVIALTQLAACAKTVRWEEEVPLNTGDTIWVRRSVDYVLKGASGNPLDIAYRPEWDAKLEFVWQGKKYIYEGDAQAFVLAISPRHQPVLVADPDDGVWRGKHDYRYCSTPTYVQLVPNESGRKWSWLPAIEPWLYGLPANLMQYRGKPEEMKRRYTTQDRAKEDAVVWHQFPPTARIDRTYKSSGFCKGRS